MLEDRAGSSEVDGDDVDEVVLIGVVLDGVDDIAASSCATPESTIRHRRRV